MSFARYQRASPRSHTPPAHQAWPLRRLTKAAAPPNKDARPTRPSRFNAGAGVGDTTAPAVTVNAINQITKQLRSTAQLPPHALCSSAHSKEVGTNADSFSIILIAASAYWAGENHLFYQYRSDHACRLTLAHSIRKRCQ